MMAVGFFVLTLGDARPLKNVGGLTAAAMIAASIATFIVCPLLARKHRYAPGADAPDPAGPGIDTETEGEDPIEGVEGELRPSASTLAKSAKRG